MFKLILFLIILATGVYFAVNQIPSLKERVIETINPAAKERRLLGELEVNLGEISKSFEEMSKQKNPAKTQEKIQDGTSLLEKSKNLLGEISKINQGTGIIGSQIGKIIDALSDKTPYPADHLESATRSPSPIFSCPPPN